MGDQINKTAATKRKVQILSMTKLFCKNKLIIQRQFNKNKKI